jgi:hypothetical protein
MAKPFDIETIINIAIGLIIVAALIPVALNMFSSADIEFTGSMAGIENLWTLIPMMVILAIAIGIIYYAMSTIKDSGR